MLRCKQADGALLPGLHAHGLQTSDLPTSAVQPGNGGGSCICRGQAVTGEKRFNGGTLLDSALLACRVL